MRRLIILTLAVVTALPAVFAFAALPESGAVAKGAAFIRGTQQPDGGFGGFGPGQTMDAIYAIRSAGIRPETVKTGGKSPADYLLANAAGADTPAAAAKAALAARAMEMDPRNVAGVDLIARIQAGYADGHYGADDFTQSIAILGLACNGNDIPSRAILALRDTQLADGGWGFGGASDPDTAAIVVQALLAAGIPADDSDVEAAIAYFKSTQAADGGWGFDPAASNASSTAFAVQALIAAGEPVESATYTKAGKTPISYMLSQQLANGSFAGFDPAFGTNQVVPALAGRSFCFAPMTAIQETPATPTATATSSATATATATATASKTATKTPTKTPTKTRTATPRPPRTGTGAEGGDDNTAIVLLGITGGVVLLSAAGFAATRRR